MRNFRTAIAAVLAVGVALTACASDERPGEAEWSGEWETAVAVIPDLSVFAEGPDRAVCDDTLRELRTLRPDVEVTPDAALDAAVKGWFTLAEEMFFDCPPAGETITGFPAAYEELARFEREVAAVLGNG